MLFRSFGVQGQATVTGSYATGSTFNDRQVMGHDVLIKTSDGKTVETSFEDDDFNVYPPANSVIYPQEGDQFNVSHLQRFPQDFVIISNDDSPWAKGLRCGKLMSAVHKADNKRQFAPDSLAFRKAYEDAVQAARAASCEGADDASDSDNQ